MNLWRAAVQGALWLQGVVCCGLICNMMGIAGVRDWVAVGLLEGIVALTLMICAFAKAEGVDFSKHEEED